jgi:hypothetical protein
LTSILTLNRGFVTDVSDVLESATWTWTSCDLVTLNESGIDVGVRL